MVIPDVRNDTRPSLDSNIHEVPYIMQVAHAHTHTHTCMHTDTQTHAHTHRGTHTDIFSICIYI